jgi:ATP-binding cassette subfamily B multidrug efflux pump
MSDFREEEKLGKLYDSALTRRLMKYLRPYRWHVVAAVSITLGVTAMEIVSPYLFHIAVDKYIVPGFNSTITRNKALIGLLWVVAASAGALLGSF